jgi:HK97 family phage major capsid protein
MNLIELADKREQKLKQLEDITECVKSESRKMNDDESAEFTRIKNEIEEINAQIDEVKETDKRSGDVVNKKNNERKMNTNFSLLKTIRDIVERKSLSEETISMINAGKRAFQDAGVSATGDIVLPFELRVDPVLAGTATQGQEVVSEEKMPLLEALKAKTVLGQAGATFYTNLKNDISIPTYDGTSVYWGTETGIATGGTGAFAEITLAPKRLTAQMSISKQFLVQDSISAEQALMNDLMSSILVKLENSIFSADAAVSGQRPAGIFNGATLTGSLSGATSWSKLVALKSAVDSANALTGNLAYVTNPTLAGVLETTSTDSGSGIFCLNNGKVAGYPVYVTSNIPVLDTSYQGIIFGNWADYVVAQWGGMDITIDPYSKAGQGLIVITANTFWDFKVRRSASFKLAKMS